MVETNLIPRARDAEIRPVDMGVRVGEGGTNWEIRIHTYTMCKADS